MERIFLSPYAVHVQYLKWKKYPHIQLSPMRAAGQAFMKYLRKWTVHYFDGRNYCGVDCLIYIFFHRKKILTSNMVNPLL